MIHAVGFVLLMILAGGLGCPPVLFVMPAAALWSVPLAFVYSMIGGLGASLLGFCLTRYGLRERVAPRIPAKIRRFESRLETHAFSTVLVMRLLFYLFPPLNWMLGLSEISLRTYLAATFLGMLPATALYVWAGEGIFGFLLQRSPGESLVALLLLGAGLFGWARWVFSGKERRM
ncbi:MAG: TVP38/TMEM64 family protein [Kiritimatiellia bacterium]